MRIITIIFSYIIASWIAGVVFMFGLLGLYRVSSYRGLFDHIIYVAQGSFLTALFVVVIAAFPTGIMIYVAERLNWRSLDKHLITGVCIGLICSSLAFSFEGLLVPQNLAFTLASSIIGAYIYWRLIGREPREGR